MSPARCEGFEPLLQHHSEGSLSPLQRAKLDRHLNSCSVCRQEVLDTEALFQALSPPPFTAREVQLVNSLQARVPQAARAQLRRNHAVWRGAVSLAVAAGVMVLVWVPQAVHHPRPAASLPGLVAFAAPSEAERFATLEDAFEMEPEDLGIPSGEVDTEKSDAASFESGGL